MLSIEQGMAPMVALEYVARSARRHDTVVAWAFRRVLGLDGCGSPPTGCGFGREMIKFRGVRECFANRGRSPVEWPQV